MATDPDSKGLEGASRPVSLRLRLTGLSILTLIVSFGLVGLALDSAFRDSAETDLQQRMETWAYGVLGAGSVSGDGAFAVDAALGDPLLNQPGSGVYAHVHGESNHWNSSSALGIEVPELPDIAPGQSEFSLPSGPINRYVYQQGFAWELEDGRVTPFTVSILVDQAWLQEDVQAFRAGLWQSLSAAGLILVLAQFLYFRLALKPLRQVTDDVARIESGESETLGGPYPLELEPLTRNLDRLLSTEKANQARYRNALDSLAHSLKTPLAVIRAAGHGERSRDAAAVDQAVDDMQHLIASRLERAAAPTRRTLARPVAVLPVAERLERSMRKVHSQKLRTLALTIEPGLMFFGEERDLLEIMGNLLDNACKYGDGQVSLAAGSMAPESSRPGLWLEVDNDGEPVSPAAAERLLQRGVRGDERVEGHGLGLTIVTEVVAAYSGELAFGTGVLGGSRVRVELPPA